MIDFHSFAKELVKIAMVETKQMGTFRKSLEPGDILLTSFDHANPLSGPGTKLKAPEKAFRRISKRYQGNTEHSAIYTGRGKVIETGPRTGAVVKPLGVMTGVKGGIVAVRPDVDPKERRQAVVRARQLLGTKYSIPRLARAGLANYVRLKPEKVSDRTKHKYICSTLVGDAYNRVQFNERKPADALMPADFYRSDKTEVVGKLIPKR